MERGTQFLLEGLPANDDKILISYAPQPALRPWWGVCNPWRDSQPSTGEGGDSDDGDCVLVRKALIAWITLLPSHDRLRSLEP